MNDRELDAQVRTAAFNFLAEQTQLHGDILTWEILSKGFLFKGQKVSLVSVNGIFKPAILPLAPLSLRTAAPDGNNYRLYNDEIGADGQIKYRYRGDNPDLGDNVRLRAALHENVPLVYLFGVSTGRYKPVWPAYVVADSKVEMAVTLAMDDPTALIGKAKDHEYSEEAPRRRYVTTLVQRRLHQQLFREQVIRAYRVQCAICRLQHDELLEAAHIIPDSDPEGAATVSNGISLCSIHHTAYDRNILGIRPDCVVQVRKDVLSESDGPMLKYGLQGFQDQRISVPRQEMLKPNPAFLGRRFSAFLSADR
ncbi:MAG: HNH endonuclease [Burkholderiales bacterium]